MGSRLALLMLTMPRWIVRRVDQIELHDDTNARRRVSIDFTLPAQAPPIRLASGERVAFVPLTYLAKARLRNFDLRDEAGTALPLLTKRENGELAAAALGYLARLTLTAAPEDEVRVDLANLTYASDASAPDLLARLFRREGAARPNRFLLQEDQAFRVVAERLAESFLLIVPLLHSAGRRVLKFAFDEPFESKRTTRQRFVESLSWEPTTTLVRLAGVGVSGSYHLEAAAPQELTVTSGQLLSTHAQVDLDEGPRPRIHLMTETRSEETLAVLRLMAPRGGIIRISFFTALLTAVVLTAGAFRLSSLVEAKDGVATVLVSFPALIAIYIARPGEHALTSRLLFGVRVCVLVSGVISFAASALLLAGPGGQAREATWWSLDGLALLMAAMLFVSLARSRKPRKMPYRPPGVLRS